MIDIKLLPHILLDAHDPNTGIGYILGHDNESFCSLPRLREKALGILKVLQDRGVKPGSFLILYLNSNEQIIDIFWACLLGGIVPVPVATGISDEHKMKVFRIFEKLDNPFLYTDTQNYNRLQGFATNHDILFNKIESRKIVVEAIHDISVPGEIHNAKPEDLAFIQFSSGSTSDPKGVMVTHDNFSHNLAGMITSAKITTDDIFLGWMPLTHDMGLIGFHLMPFYRGITHYNMPTEVFIRRPLLWMTKISEKRVTFTGSPNFGYKHFLNGYTPDKFGENDLSCLKIVFNGAEPISKVILDEFIETMKPYGFDPAAMFPVYGLAEATLGMAFPEVGSMYHCYWLNREKLGIGDTIEVLPENDPAAVPFICEGKAIKYGDIAIFDQEWNRLPDRTVGIVCIKGPFVTSGYYKEDQVNRENIRDGWLNAGDLGFLDNGNLTLTGRHKEVLFRNGQNLYPHDLEHIAARVDGVEIGKVVVSGWRAANSDEDEVLVFVLQKGKYETLVPVASEIRSRINMEAGIKVAKVIPVRKILKTTSGKVQRLRMAKEYSEGMYDDNIAELERIMPEDSKDNALTATEAQIKEVCDAFTGETQLSVHDNIFEAGTTSLALTQIHEKLDEIYPGKLEITDYFDHPTIAELAKYLNDEMRETNA